MDLKKATFLIADDYSTTITLIVSTLKQKGYTGEILTAENGAIAYDLLKKNKVDFIISDVVMPEMTGVELLRKVKTDHPEFANLPFLMLTAENDRAVVMEAIKLGVSNYLIKPWSPEILLEKVEFCWNKHHS